jgi:alpha-galactosidase
LAGGNLWRTGSDIRDDWSSVMDNAHHELGLSKFAGPGHWNDPDMLEIGNGHITDDEYNQSWMSWMSWMFFSNSHEIVILSAAPHRFTA